MDMPGGLCPVDDAHVLGEHGGVGIGAVILNRAVSGSGTKLFHSFGQRLGPQLRQPRRQRLGILLGVNIGFQHMQNVPGVQLPGHVHDGHAGLPLAVEDGPVDGSRPPVFGQQGRMNVDGAIGRGVQNVLRQDAAIGRHHDQLRMQLPHQGQGRAVPHFRGLIHGQPLGQGVFLHRRKGQLMPPVFGAVRLGEHAADLVSVLHQPLQGRHREIRRAHKQDPHSSSSPSSCCRIYSSSSSSVSRWSVRSTNR